MASEDRQELFNDNLELEEVPSLGGTLLNNRVLVEVDQLRYETTKTKSGLELYIDDTHILHQYTVRHGIVAQLPKRLTFWEEDKESGLAWRTEMEIEVGDTVWFTGMSSHSGEKLSFKGKKYILIHYQDLYVAKRGNKVIPLNSNILLEPIKETVKALSYEKVIDRTTVAKIAFIGRLNTEYEFEDREDDEDLETGMTVFIKDMVPRWLEMEPYLHFDGNRYMVCQNYEIRGYIKNKK